MTQITDIIQALESGDYSVLASMGKREREVLHAAVKAMRGIDPASLVPMVRDGYERVVPTVDEFLGLDGRWDYMDPEFGASVFGKWKDELRYVLSPENRINLWFIRGSMGGGKSYAATAAMVYKMLESGLMIDPAQSLGLASGSQLVCALFNATKYLADDVNYGYLTEFLSRCRWFYQVREQIRTEDRKRRIHGNVLDLPKNIRVALGSDQFMMLGKNVLWGLLDEANWRDRVVSADEQDKVYDAFQGIYRRIKTRFAQEDAYIPRSLFIVVSSEREMSATMDRLCEQYGSDPHAHITQFALWDVKPAEGDDTDQVWVGVPGKTGILPRLFDTEDDAKQFAQVEGNVVPVPRRFKSDFEADILGSLNDLAGVSVETGETKFFYQPERIESCDSKRPNPVIDETVEHGLNSQENLSEYLLTEHLCKIYDLTTGTYRPIHYPHSSRAVHIDLSINHDACGITMACLGDSVVQTVVTETQREIKLPEYRVWVDFFLRIKAPRGDRIHFAAIRKLVVWLDKVCGFPVSIVSYDGFESEDSVQILERRGYKAVKVSVDRTLGPYSTLLDLVNYDRLDMPTHSYVKAELANLVKTRRKRTKTIKIDHPRMMRMGSKSVEGSKDVADSLCGSAYNLVTQVAIQRTMNRPDQLGVQPPGVDQSRVRSLRNTVVNERRQSLRDMILHTGDQGDDDDEK